MSTTFDAYQQVVSLSFASNLLANAAATTPVLQEQINKALPIRLAEKKLPWQVTWGPVVWKLHSDDTKYTPDNVQYIAHNPSFVLPGNEKPQNTYVVAVAGTSTNSEYAWSQEDENVSQVVDLFEWINQAGGLEAPFSPATDVKDAEKTYISAGTACGLTVLLANAPPKPYSATDPGPASIGVPLIKYLQSLPADATVIFTGHSLGSALSTALGVAMVKAGVVAQVSSVLAYPSAGPTPGNANFVKTFQEVFPTQPLGEKPYQQWNANFINTLDIVPQAWCTDTNEAQNVSTISNFYGCQGLVKLYLKHIKVPGMIKAANASQVIYRPLPANPFTSDLPLPNPNPSLESGFTKDFLFMHEDAYNAIFGFAPASLKAGDKLDPGVTLMTPEQKEASLPILGSLEGVGAGAPSEVGVEA